MSSANTISYSLCTPTRHDQEETQLLKTPPNLYFQFANKLGVKPKDATKEQGFCSKMTEKVWTDLKKETLCNSARNKVGDLFHRIEGGKVNSKYKNSLYDSFEEISESQLFVTDQKEDIPEDLKIKNFQENLKKIRDAFNGYCAFLIKPEKSKNIKEETTQFFNNLLNLIPEEKKEETKEPIENDRSQAKKALNTIIQAGSKIVNHLDASSQEDHVIKYFEACEQFVNVFFKYCPKKLNNLKGLILNCISTAGLLLTYLPRTMREKTCVLLKRLFVPIGYIMHELCGVALQLFVNPYIFAAVCPTGAWALSLLATFAAGYGIVRFCDFLLDASADVAKDHINTKIHNNNYDIKKYLQLLSSEDSLKINKETNSFFLRWLKKIGETSTFNKDQLKENMQSVKSYMETLTKQNPIIPSWYKEENITGNKDEIKKYFDNLNLFNRKELNKLFYYQNKLVNSVDHLSEEEIEELKEKLEKIYHNIAVDILQTSRHDHANKDLINYLKYRLEAYSQVLVSNSRNLLHKAAKYSAPLTFFTFDFIADTCGVIITSKIEETSLTATQRLATEILGSLAGAFIPIGVGILVHFFVSAISYACDKSGIQIPNKNVKDYISPYLDGEETRLNLEQIRLKKEQKNTDLFEKGLDFSYAKQAQPAFELNEIESIKKINIAQDDEKVKQQKIVSNVEKLSTLQRVKYKAA